MRDGVENPPCYIIYINLKRFINELKFILNKVKMKKLNEIILIEKSTGSISKGETMLEVLDNARIFNIKKIKNDEFEIEESCDDYFAVTLNKNQMKLLINELNNLIK